MEKQKNKAKICLLIKSTMKKEKKITKNNQKEKKKYKNNNYNNKIYFIKINKKIIKKTFVQYVRKIYINKYIYKYLTNLLFSQPVIIFVFVEKLFFCVLTQKKVIIFSFMFTFQLQNVSAAEFKCTLVQ